jgi:hypothetical protein
MIAARGYRCTTFRDGSNDGSGPFAVMRCDYCGAEAHMARKDSRTLTSPPGWQDAGDLDKCPACAATARRDGEG